MLRRLPEESGWAGNGRSLAGFDGVRIDWIRGREHSGTGVRLLRELCEFASVGAQWLLLGQCFRSALV